MPRLQYYFIGASIIGSGYFILYQRWYLPYTTYQRQMELVLEAEKFVSQQLLQRAERLQREVTQLCRRSTTPADKARGLPSALASVYGLLMDFEHADVQKALPKSLYVARLSKLKRQCARRIDRLRDLSTTERLRCAVAYGLFVLLHRVLPEALRRMFEGVVGNLIARLLLIDVAVIGSTVAQRQQHQQQQQKKSLLRDANEEDDASLVKRDDAVVAASETEKGSEQRITNVLFASHWIEEFVTRFALRKNDNDDTCDLVVFYPDSSAQQQPLKQQQNEQQQQQLAPNYLAHGFPWFDSDRVEAKIGAAADSSVSSSTAIRIVRPITVAGVAQLLFTVGDGQNKAQRAKEAEEKKKQAEASIEAEVAAAVSHAKASPSSFPPSAFGEEGDNPAARYDEAELLRRRRIMLDPNRVKDEKELSQKEAELKELLYSSSSSSSSNSKFGSVAAAVGELSEQQSESGDQAPRSKPGESNPVFIEDKEKQAAVEDGDIEPVPNEMPRALIAGPLDGCGERDPIDGALSPVQVRLGSACVVDALWSTMLREGFDAEVDTI